MRVHKAHLSKARDLDPGLARDPSILGSAHAQPSGNAMKFADLIHDVGQRGI